MTVWNAYNRQTSPGAAYSICPWLPPPLEGEEPALSLLSPSKDEGVRVGGHERRNACHAPGRKASSAITWGVFRPFRTVILRARPLTSYANGCQEAIVLWLEVKGEDAPKPPGMG